MTLTWIICGAGRGVGKTRLAKRLCESLPDAVYAKQGCGPRRPDKPANLFRTIEETAAFIDQCLGHHEHVIVESNALARAGRGDIVIFVNGPPGQVDTRPDADELRARAHLVLDASARPEDWHAALAARLRSPELVGRVCDLLVEQRERSREQLPGLVRVEPLRVDTADASVPVVDPGDVADEALVTIQVEGVGNYAILCTPTELEALAVGFTFCEGLLRTRDDVRDLRCRPAEHLVALRLDAPESTGPQRQLIVTSACGLCGRRNVEQLMAASARVGDTLRIPPPTLRAVVQQMAQRQRLFQRTGGTHAAAVFTPAGEIVALAEDIGRHNALDKVLGQCLLRYQPVAGLAGALSGRVSLELVAKAARAGLELIAAVSAPSALAIRLADRAGITLCGFVRGQRATIYTHPHRVVTARDVA